MPDDPVRSPEECERLAHYLGLTRDEKERYKEFMRLAETGMSYRSILKAMQVERVIN
jgi:hypothetical protein